MYALPQSFFWKNMNWKENSWIQRRMVRFCHHDRMYLSRVFTGAACRAEHLQPEPAASDLGTVALTVGLFKKSWQHFYSDHISIWIQLWCKGTRNTAKVRRQRAFYRDGLWSAGQHKRELYSIYVVDEPGSTHCTLSFPSGGFEVSVLGKEWRAC